MPTETYPKRPTSARDVPTGTRFLLARLIRGHRTDDNPAKTSLLREYAVTLVAILMGAAILVLLAHALR